MDNELYWVWLTSKKVIKANKITSLFEKYNSIEDIYAEKRYLNVPNIGIRELDALKDKSLEQVKKIIDETHKHGGYVVTFESENYPNKLRNIENPPYILYCRGDFINVDDILTIAVVGTRRVTEYGRIVTSRFSYDLAKAGATVISVMARGVDTIAARSALKAGGKTIAVLGRGLDEAYPKENAGLMEEIASNGMVITEYAVGEPPIALHFPERNRIIAGLANGVLITDAPKGSGALITANIAQESGRDVFAVPRGILDDNVGANRLIQQGAKLVMSCADITEEYPYMERVEIGTGSQDADSEHSAASVSDAFIAPEADNAPKAENPPKTKVKAVDAPKAGSAPDFSKLGELESKIAEALIIKNMQIDELAQSLNETAGTLNKTLTMLELKGIVRKLPGGFYKIKSD